MMELDALVDFHAFVEERHNVWVRRWSNWRQDSWTSDPILRTRKFTNVFRVLDYGSQFLVRELIDPGDEPEDVLMRCFLYRHTNLPAAWEAFNAVEGCPTIEDLDRLRDFWKGYRDEGNRVFSGAYMIYPQSAVPGTDKIDSIIDLTKRLFHPKRGIVKQFMEAQSPRARFAVLRMNKGVADFMSMQILTDWGYTDHCGEDQENMFVVPGPGARKGAAFLDPRRKAEDMIPELQETIHSSPFCPELPTGRKPSLMDVQNCLCEFSKYHRYQSKPSPKREFVPAHPGVVSTPVLPDHWNR